MTKELVQSSLKCKYPHCESYICLPLFASAETIRGKVQWPQIFVCNECHNAFSYSEDDLCSRLVHPVGLEFVRNSKVWGKHIECSAATCKIRIKVLFVSEPERLVEHFVQSAPCPNCKRTLKLGLSTVPTVDHDWDVLRKSFGPPAK